jgi:hypothetical protein
VDGHKRARGDPNFLTLWQPVAPAGYVAMGVLAAAGAKEPDMSKVSQPLRMPYGFAVICCHANSVAYK